MENSEIEMTEANDISDHKVGETISDNKIDDQKVCDIVVISIDKMLEQLPLVNPKCNIIYQVPKELREINDKAYIPQFISIGPFHYGTRNDLIDHEHYKLQGFLNFLRRINNNNIQSLEVKNTTSLLLKELVEKSHGWVKDTWNCYAEPIKMKDEEFVMMMLVDACFIVEFFILLVDEYDLLGLDDKFIRIKDNVDFSLWDGIFYEILLDLIKLENQVPFFLLQNLFDLIPKDDVPSIRGDEDGRISLIHLTYRALKGFGFLRNYRINNLYHKQPKHLLDFLSFYFVPLPPDHDRLNKQHDKRKSENNFLSFFRCLIWNKKPDPVKSIKKWRLSSPSITELCEAGVIIKVAEKEHLCFMNISFKNGVLEIPPVFIEGTFEVMIRNVLAFEVFPAGNQKRYAIQYVSFLDDLICTEKDLCLLVKAGVIINDTGGSDKEVSELFNNLSKLVTTPLSSHFDDTSKALRLHCNVRWNKAKASLKHNYFNTPWTVISFVAAAFLIILTILQTIFSAISAFPH